MAGTNRGACRPVVFWATCPECFTYIWVESSTVSGEESLDCPYCEEKISMLGGAELSDCCDRLQVLLESVEQQIGDLPAAIDVHRFLSEQVDYIAQAFNDRLDSIQEQKDDSLLNAAVAAKPAD